jgi:phosphate transport system substrate-binding protein
MRSTKNKTSLVILALVAALAPGCGSSHKTSATSEAANANGGTGKAVLVGAGSTFVYPLMTEWIKDYAESRHGSITYGPIGSGGGIRSVTSSNYDFGASDVPLTLDEASACDDCVQIPWALAGTSISYNVPGAPDHLKLTGDVLARIYLGTIKRWNDPAIAKLNAGKTLPDIPITPIHRRDSSGTTFNFTDYLTHVNAQWKSSVGVGPSVNWPIGAGARGSSGVAGVLSRTKGGIGYVDAAYSLRNGLAVAAIRNRAGGFVLPTTINVAAAASSLQKVPQDKAISIVDPPAGQPKAYPISTFTYVIVHKGGSKARQLQQFLRYAIGPGQAFGPKLQFAKLPPIVLAADRKAIDAIG